MRQLPRKAQRICEHTGWNDDSLIIHLVGFILGKGLADELDKYFERAAKAEVGETEFKRVFGDDTPVENMKTQSCLLATLAKLPLVCFSTLNSNPCQLIGLHRGVPGYTPLRVHNTPEQAEAQADRLNKARGVTPQQREAMEIGSCFGWHVPGADPDRHHGEKQ